MGVDIKEISEKNNSDQKSAATVYKRH